MTVMVCVAKAWYSLFLSKTIKNTMIHNTALLHHDEHKLILHTKSFCEKYQLEHHVY